MRHIGRRLGALVGAVAVALIGGLTLQTAQAAPMVAQFAPPPAIPIAPSVFGPAAGAVITGTAEGGAVTAATGAGALTVAGYTAIAAGVYFGTTYGTYKTLQWAFGPNHENTGAQPFEVGDEVNTTKAGSCTVAAHPSGATYSFFPGFGFRVGGVAGCPTISGSTIAIDAIGPPWRCLIGASCYANVKWIFFNTANTPVLTRNFCCASGGEGGSSGGATSVIWPTGSGTYGGVRWVTDNGTVEWNPSPQHRWRTLTSCKNMTTGSITVQSIISAPFRENEASPLPTAVPQCGAGYRATKLEIWEIPEPDVTGAGYILRYGWTAPPDVVAPIPQQTSPYKTCYPGGADAPCILSLWKLQTDATLKNCASGTVDCTDYDHITSTVQTYRCMWGTFSMPISDCEGLETWAKTQTSVQPTTDPTATTQPTTSTSVQPLPTTGTNIDPKTGLPTTGTTVPTDSTDTNGGNCMGSVWSWNPVNWVYIPIKCGLQWAFVPSTSSMTGLSGRVTTALNASAPGKWVGAVDTLKTSMTGSEAGCLGPRVNWAALPNGGFYPFKACDGIMATVAGVTKILATIAVTFFGGLACLRALGSGLGWSPGVGKGGDG